MRDEEQKLALLEATLFTTTEPLSTDEIHKITRIRKDDIGILLNKLKDKYSSQKSGIMLSTTGGYRLTVKEQFAQKVSHLTPHADLSRGLLRVLAIIAYHEPIPQSDIVKVVGNRTYEYVKDLLNRSLIKAERKSRTRILSLTPQFEEYFGITKESLKQSLEKEDTEKD